VITFFIWLLNWTTLLKVLYLSFLNYSIYGIIFKTSLFETKKYKYEFNEL